MKTTILNIYDNENEIRLIMGLSEHEDLMELFEADPDILKIGDHQEFFLTIEANGQQYLITTATDMDCCNLLNKWAEGTVIQRESSWDIFTSLPNAVAYRGGVGYGYGIYEFVA